MSLARLGAGRRASGVDVRFDSVHAPVREYARRLSLDLTGLPPTIAEVDAFLADKSAGAYEKVVDRLLASPSFGEKLALAEVG